MIQNLVPQFILEKYAQQEFQGRFPAVCLFCDLSGFSAVTNALMRHGDEAAEAIADLMLATFEPLVELIYGHSGFIAGFAGDGFTALFPLASPSVAGYQQALAAGVGIQRYMAAHAGQETPYGRFTFAIRQGLADGEVEWGILEPDAGGVSAGESEVKAACFFRGPAIDGAAAAEHAAASGEIILSAAVREVLGDGVVAEPAGEHVFRLGAVPGALPCAQPPSYSSPYAEHMAAFVPAAVHQRRTRGEFRTVFSLFVQLMGIDTGAQLARFMQSVFARLRRYGGYLNHIDFGDKGCNLLIFWGAPTSFENDLERALSCILDLRDHTEQTLRAGLTYQPAYAGLTGSLARGEFSCYGVGVNLAARLMMAASWGDVWLGENVARRARQHYEIEDLGPQAFKGFAQDLPVYLLWERREQDQIATDLIAGTMVGREDELGQLAEFIQPLSAPQGEGDPAGRSRFAGILVVQGEAGLGKTRLVHEFLARPSQFPNFQTFLCQSDQTLRQSLNPFRYWLQRYFEQSAGLSEARNKRSFSRKLDRIITSIPEPELQQELNRTRSFLGALVDLFWENSLYAELDPQSRFANTLMALKALVKAESLLQPVILHIEDAHWLDEDSIQFLHELTRNVQTYPFALVATARPRRDGPLLGEGLVSRRIDLSPLPAHSLARMAESLLGAAPGPALVELLVQRAEGNPFFAEQLLLYLQEQGLLAQGELQPTAGDIVPGNVRAVLIARLDRLAQQVREVVQTAAVLGREFEVRVLSHMLRQDPDIQARMEAAERATVWAALSELRYLFKHALLRDTAYEIQLKARRRQLHQLAAEALESLYALELPSHYGEIAHHYEAAFQYGRPELRDVTGGYLEKAGRLAAERYENHTALDFFRRALALTPEREVGRTVELLLAREKVHDLQSAREAQSLDLGRLEPLAEALGPAKQAEVSLRRSHWAEGAGDLEAAVAAARQAVAWAEAAQEEELLAEGHAAWGRALLVLGDYDASKSHLEQALEILQRLGKRRQAAWVLNRGLGGVFFFQGAYVEGQRCCRQALAVYQEEGDRRGQGDALMNLGAIAHSMNDFIAAQDYYRQALVVYREIGDRRGVAWILGNMGSLWQELGMYGQARQYHEQALGDYCEAGDRQGEGLTLGNLGLVAHYLGESARSLDLIEQALSVQREVSDRRGQAYSLHYLGARAYDLGEFVQAEGYFQQAMSIRQELGQHHLVFEDQAGMAQAALAQGDLAQAQAYLAGILPGLEDHALLEGTENLLGVLLAGYQLLQAGGDDRATAVLSQAHTLLQERAAEIDDVELRQAFLQNVPEHREIVRAFSFL